MPGPRAQVQVSEPWAAPAKPIFFFIIIYLLKRPGMGEQQPTANIVAGVRAILFAKSRQAIGGKRNGRSELVALSARMCDMPPFPATTSVSS